MPNETTKRPSNPSAVLKDGLLCVLTAFGFLALLGAFALIYGWAESLLPLRFQSPLYFWEFMAIIQSPSIIPTFRSARESASFPSWKHLGVIVEITLLGWALVSLSKAGSFFASLIGLVIFILAFLIPLSPLIWYFTTKAKQTQIPPAA